MKTDREMVWWACFWFCIVWFIGSCWFWAWDGNRSDRFETCLKEKHKPSECEEASEP